ncbi:fasciclin domain protein [Leptolyngbya sp. NIES-3755]|nr:fasciclin domain protein [Leptolyngbya sp. NIES-3755]
MKISALRFDRAFTTALVFSTVLFGFAVQAEACPRSSAKTSPAVATRPTQAGTVVDIAAGNPSFTTLVQAVQAAGLVETLSGKGPFTVFAPTNEAFAALPQGTLEKLLLPENRETLRKILTYHVVAGNVLSKDLRSGQVATVEGNPVAVQVRNQRIRVNNANVVTADISGSNGVIHVIDRVILPPDLKL